MKIFRFFPISPKIRASKRLLRLIFKNHHLSDFTNSVNHCNQRPNRLLCSYNRVKITLQPLKEFYLFANNAANLRKQSEKSCFSIRTNTRIHFSPAIRVTRRVLHSEKKTKFKFFHYIRTQSVAKGPSKFLIPHTFSTIKNDSTRLYVYSSFTYHRWSQEISFSTC